MTRRRRAGLLVIMCCLAMQSPANGAPPLPAGPPKVTTNPLQHQLYAYGDAATGDRWTGSDGAYDVGLPDGRRLWLWGDTFLGTVNDDHSRAPQGFVHNAATIQHPDGSFGDTLYTHVEGWGDFAWIGAADGQTWYWFGDGTIEGDKYRQILYRIGGIYIIGVDVATLSLPDLTLESITPMPGAYIPGAGTPTEYGVSIVETDDYTYVYGCESFAIDKFLHVARVPSGHLLDGQWEYWDGTAWTINPLTSARIRSNVADEMSVVKTKSGYRAIASFVGIGAQIYMYTSPNPEGPWSEGTLLYTTPETNAETITYNAKEHPDFNGRDYIVISYNVNAQTGNSDALYSNVDNYRPRFINVYVPPDLPAKNRVSRRS